MYEDLFAQAYALAKLDALKPKQAISQYSPEFLMTPSANARCFWPSYEFFSRVPPPSRHFSIWRRGVAA